MRLSEKLGALCAAAAILPLLVASFVVLSQLSAHTGRQASESMQRDARTAGAILEKRLSELRAAAGRLADDIANRALVSSDSTGGANAAAAAGALARLQDMLPRAQQDYLLDLIIVADPQGRVIARHNDKPAAAESLTTGDDRNSLAAAALSGGKSVAAAAIERSQRLKLLGMDLRARVDVTNGTAVDDGLVLEAAAPIQRNGQTAGIVLIGQMVNNDSKPRPGASALQTPLVAEIQQTVYRTSEDGGAVIALRNVIVSSSVAGAPGSGTTSALVGVAGDPANSEQVARQGNEGYVVAWQPIKANDGADIGRVGTARNIAALAGPTGAARTSLLLIAAIAVTVAGAAGFIYGRALGLRLEALTEAVNRWTVGDLSAPAKDRDPMMARWVAGFALRDEIARLGTGLEEMRQSFRQAIERMRKR